MSTIRINRPEAGLVFIWRGGHTVNITADGDLVDALSCGDWETGETTLAHVQAAIDQYLIDRQEG